MHLNPCTIDGDVITTWIFTRFGKSVHRVIWRGFWHCLERRTSGLVIVEPIRVLGPSFNSQKKTSFVQDSRISYWVQLVCPISALLLYGFQSNLVSPESYSRGESNAICYEGRGLLLMENVGNYRNCATRIILEILVTIIKSGFLLSGHSPLLPRMFSFSLAPIWVIFGSFWGRNMTFTSRIVRVRVLLLLEWACRSEFLSVSDC